MMCFCDNCNKYDVCIYGDYCCKYDGLLLFNCLYDSFLVIYPGDTVQVDTTPVHHIPRLDVECTPGRDVSPAPSARKNRLAGLRW